MTHASLARVWGQLQHAHTEVNNILRDIIGEQALATGGKAIHTISDLSFRYIVWIRVIIDLQWYHLLGSPFSNSSDAAPRSHLLSPPILFSTLHHLLDVRCRVYPNIKDGLYMYERHFIMQSLLSGFRMLLLQHEHASSLQFGEISRRLRELNSQSDTVEKFIITKCLQAILEISPAPGEHCTSQTHHSVFEVGGSPGLIKEARLDTTALNLETCFKTQLKDLDKGNEDAFWFLLDLIWSLEAGCVEQFSAVTDVTTSSATSSDIVSLKYLVACLDSSNPTKSCLRDFTLGWCNGANCGCSSNTTEIRSKTDGLDLFISTVDKRLKDLNTFLKKRMLDHFKCRENDFPFLYNEILNSWFKRARESEFSDNLQQATDLTPWVMGCEKLHPVPASVLEGLIKDIVGPEFQLGSQRSFHHTEKRIPCPGCPSENLVHSVRKLDPLPEILELLRYSPSKASDPIPEGRPCPEACSVHDSKQETPEDCGSAETLPNTITASTAQSGLPSPEKKKLWRRTWSKGRSDQSSSSETQSTGSSSSAATSTASFCPTSYAFASNGWTLLLWDIDVIVSYNIRCNSTSIPRIRRYQVPGDKIDVAGGDKWIIAGLKNNLYIFDATSCELFTKQLPPDAVVRHVVVSRGSEFFAVGFGTHSYLYQPWYSLDGKFELKELKVAPGVPMGTINSQRLSFTPGDHQLISAIRDVQGKVVITAYNVPNGESSWELVKKIPIGYTPDFGLTSALYDADTCAIVTAYVSAKYDVLHNTKPEGTLYPRPTGWDAHHTRYHTAVQSPVGSVIAFVCSSGKLCKLDTGEKRYKSVAQLPHDISSVTHNRHLISAAMPDEHNILTFWISGGKFILTKFTENGDPQREELVINPET